MRALLHWTLCCLSASVLYVAISPVDKAQERKSYFNKNFEFCVHFPSDWSSSEPYTRTGVTLAPDKQAAFSLPPRIALGAHMNQPSQTGNGSQTLDENIQSYVDSLREYGSAVDIQILRKDEITLGDLPGKSIVLKYRDSHSGKEWFAKDFNLIDGNNTVYFAELKCHPKDAVTLESIFDALLRSLRLQCKGKSRKGIGDGGTFPGGWQAL